MKPTEKPQSEKTKSYRSRVPYWVLLGATVGVAVAAAPSLAPPIGTAAAIVGLAEMTTRRR